MKSGNLNLQATHFTGKESVDPSSCCKIVALGRARFSLVECSKIQPNCKTGIGCVPAGVGVGEGTVVWGNVNHFQERPPPCPNPCHRSVVKLGGNYWLSRKTVVFWCCGWVRTPKEMIQFYPHVPQNKSEPIMVSATPRNTQRISVILWLV